MTQHQAAATIDAMTQTVRILTAEAAAKDVPGAIAAALRVRSALHGLQDAILREGVAWDRAESEVRDAG